MNELDNLESLLNAKWGDGPLDWFVSRRVSDDNNRWAWFCGSADIPTGFDADGELDFEWKYHGLSETLRDALMAMLAKEKIA